LKITNEKAHIFSIPSIITRSLLFLLLLVCRIVLLFFDVFL
jgi:hypothetical protein